MSGGSYDYAYTHVNDFVWGMEAHGRVLTPARRALKEVLEKASDAMHAVEWVDSGDYAPGDEDDEIAALLTTAAIVAREFDKAKEVKKG